MIEKHQILIDGLVKISQLNQIHVLMADDIAKETLQAYMGANNLEADERSFIPGYHEYISAHTYDVRHGYLNIEYCIPKNILKLPHAFILASKYTYSHGITSINETETHLIIIIDAL